MTIEHAGPFLESGLFSGVRSGVFFALANFADDLGECWPSYEAIAFTARVSRRAAIREIAWLAEHHMIEIMQGEERPREKRAVAGRCNVYRIHLGVIRAMYMLIRLTKEAVGRDPAKRYGAARHVADWAEAVISEHGAAELLRQASRIVADGAIFDLLPKSNSDTGSPFDSDREENGAPEGDMESPLTPRKGDICAAKGDTRSPYPSIYPSVEPSARARDAADWDGRASRDAPGPRPPDPAPDPARSPARQADDRGAGAEPLGPPDRLGEEARERPRMRHALLTAPVDPTAFEDQAQAKRFLEAREFAQRALIVAWLCGAEEANRFRFLAALKDDVRRGDMDDVVAAIDGPARAKAVSFVHWARAILAGAPGVRDHSGVPHMVEIVRALSDERTGARSRARAAKLLGEDERAHEARQSATGPPEPAAA